MGATSASCTWSSGDEARRTLASAETLLRSASDAFGLGVLLTSRAEAQLNELFSAGRHESA
jgi:hypothetical protein